MKREVTVVEQMVDGVDVVLGMDVIDSLGGVKVWHNKVQFGNICAVAYSGKKQTSLTKISKLGLTASSGRSDTIGMIGVNRLCKIRWASTLRI